MLEASEAGEPLYLRLGFVEVSALPLVLRPAPGLESKFVGTEFVGTEFVDTEFVDREFVGTEFVGSKEERWVTKSR